MHNALCTTHNFYYVQIMCDYVQLCANYVHYVNANVHGETRQSGCIDATSGAKFSCTQMELLWSNAPFELQESISRFWGEKPDWKKLKIKNAIARNRL